MEHVNSGGVPRRTQVRLVFGLGPIRRPPVGQEAELISRCIIATGMACRLVIAHGSSDGGRSTTEATEATEATEVTEKGSNVASLFSF